MKKLFLTLVCMLATTVYSFGYNFGDEYGYFGGVKWIKVTTLVMGDSVTVFGHLYMTYHNSEKYYSIYALANNENFKSYRIINGSFPEEYNFPDGFQFDRNSLIEYYNLYYDVYYDKNRTIKYSLPLLNWREAGKYCYQIGTLGKKLYLPGQVFSFNTDNDIWCIFITTPDLLKMAFKKHIIHHMEEEVKAVNNLISTFN